ncbi:MAG: M23 family metallopeptidase [Clostridiaceae bacterium]
MKGLKIAIAALIVTLGTTTFTSFKVQAATDIKAELNTVISELETVSKAEQESTAQIETKTNELNNTYGSIELYDVHMAYVYNMHETVLQKIDILKGKNLSPIQAIFLSLTNGYKELTKSDILVLVNSDLTEFEPIKEAYIKESDKREILEYLNLKLVAMNTEVTEYESKKSEAVATTTTLNAEITQLSAAVTDLSGKATQLVTKKSEIEQEVQRVEEEAKRIEEEARRKAEEIKRQETFIKPTSGRVSSPFGYRTHPVTGSYTLHSGMDFAASAGTTVVASRNGKVVSAGYSGTYGNLIVISHGNGIETAYAHLSSINVSVGQSVTQGQMIGKVGSTGRSTGPHLHFEVRINGTAVNPSKYIG